MSSYDPVQIELFRSLLCGVAGSGRSVRVGNREVLLARSERIQRGPSERRSARAFRGRMQGAAGR